MSGRKLSTVSTVEMDQLEKKLMDVYAQRLGGTPSAYLFVFDGNQVVETQTPDDLEMESDNVIDAMLEQVDIGVFGKHAGQPGLRLLMGSAIETAPSTAATEVNALVRQLGGRPGSRPQSFPNRQLLPLPARQALIQTLDAAHGHAKTVQCRSSSVVHDVKLDLTRPELVRLRCVGN